MAMSMFRSLRVALLGEPPPFQAELRQAGFDEADLRAIRDTPAMATQLRQFARAGGRIERAAADFAGANGQPGLIRFYCPPQPHACTHSTYGTLAHELGHALFCPQQWQPPTDFADAADYARVRAQGEAHAWLNQYRLCRRKVGGLPEPAPVLPIENAHDFGAQPVDIFARIAEREASGASEAQILEELAVLSAHMFPCGMGDSNFKTYGQCYHWNWLKATESRHPLFTAFLRQLGRPPTPHEQKMLTKLAVFTPPPHPDAATASWDEQTVLDLAAALRTEPAGRSPAQLLALVRQLVNGLVSDNRLSDGALDSIASSHHQTIVCSGMD